MQRQDTLPVGSTPLFAPWRLDYLEALEAKERSTGTPPPSSSSFLREYWMAPSRDPENHVVVRAVSCSSGGGGGAWGGEAGLTSPNGSPLDPAVLAADTLGGLILLNRYPYANGHLLVCLGDPRPTLLDYTPQQRAALWRLVDLGAALMRAALQPQGVNIGINQGRAAGAGVPQHLHAHLVPRWGGDVNFMSVVADVRVIPSSLDAMAERFRAAWRSIRPEWLRDTVV